MKPLDDMLPEENEPQYKELITLIQHASPRFAPIPLERQQQILARVRERLAQRRNEIGSVMAKVLENSERTDGAKHSSLDPTILAALLLSIFDGLALQKIMDPTFDLEAAYHLLAQMLHGLLGSFEGDPSL